ncbi:mitochondrial chaperone [Aphanomyces cochlioides]|nr:mitochondrial chaperone [Aphanomyces cochlioides]
MIHEFDKQRSRLNPRPIESVILPRATKTKLIADLDDFVSDDTKAFYANHGIPYKRSYLFYGVPGTGKTSLIQAMGGQYERNLYFLQPTHPKMTDDSLRSAIEKVPRKSIIVLEDIDALFDKDRRKKVEQSLLTFSGLLNALDGVGSPDGHIVVLTTNFRDQLDDALIRNGRVDVHVAFEHSTEEQMEAMFVSFYPGEKDGKAFATALTAALGSRKMSMAALQHYFVTQRRKSAAEAISNVGEVVRDLDERQKEADEEAARAEEEDEEEDDNEENGDDEENDEDEVKDEDETKKSSKDDQS